MRGQHVSVFLFVFLVGTAFGGSATDALTKEYKGKTIQLRRALCGSKLHFDAEGNPAKQEDAEPWTNCGRLIVESFSTEDGQFVLKGRRLFLIYNEETAKMEDVEDALDDLSMFRSLDDKKRNQATKDTREALRSLRPIKIWFGSDSASPDQALQSMRALAVEESDFNSVVPQVWTTVPINGAVFHAGRGTGVKPPKAIQTPDPEYSEMARKLKFGGTTILTLVVNESGLPEGIHVQKPLGLGLDEQAVRAVQNWKFEPAEKDGKPVAFEIHVEVTFRLY